jgi:hypothetical protein
VNLSDKEQTITVRYLFDRQGYIPSSQARVKTITIPAGGDMSTFEGLGKTKLYTSYPEKRGMYYIEVDGKGTNNVFWLLERS